MIDPDTLPDWALPIREAMADPATFCLLPEGWRELLTELDDRLAWHAPAARYEMITARFGMLRVRVSPTNAMVQSAIREAARRASITCEVCGGPGRGAHRVGVCHTLCPSCAEVRGFEVIR